MPKDRLGRANSVGGLSFGICRGSSRRSAYGCAERDACSVSFTSGSANGVVRVGVLHRAVCHVVKLRARAGTRDRRGAQVRLSLRAGPRLCSPRLASAVVEPEVHVPRSLV